MAFTPRIQFLMFYLRLKMWCFHNLLQRSFSDFLFYHFQQCCIFIQKLTFYYSRIHIILFQRTILWFKSSTRYFEIVCAGFGYEEAFVWFFRFVLFQIYPAILILVRSQSIWKYSYNFGFVILFRWWLRFRKINWRLRFFYF